MRDDRSGSEHGVARREDPFFSVLIATYNQAQYLEETLESVARQTLRDYEVVIVDDGSTDATPQVLACWREKFARERRNRVVLATIPNSGQSAAIEHGAPLCSGRYVCLLDSDDRWLPQKLQHLMEAADRHPEAGMLVHPLLVIGPHGQRTGDLRPKQAKLSDGDVREQLLRTGRHIASSTSGIAIRRDILGKLLPMPTKHFPSGADAYLAFGASLLAPVSALPEPLAEYRLHPDGQYLRRMLTPAGLERSVEMQRTIARHFGLESVMLRNSFFARNQFALEKFRGVIPRQVRSFARLASATLHDPSFGVSRRLALLTFWSLCLVSPLPVFSRLWLAFQLKQTGYGKVGLPPGGVFPRAELERCAE
jgi:glycosyltransferase involved in cell wall biosynthesis